jgi:hypothetical protein
LEGVTYFQEGGREKILILRRGGKIGGGFCPLKFTPEGLINDTCAGRAHPLP